MRLIIDTNILISALIKNSVTREILLFPSLEFLLPEYALEELEAHKGIILKKSGLSKEEIEIVLSILLDNIIIISASEIRHNLSRAKRINGIWSNDKHFENLKEIKVWKTADLFNFIGKNKG